MLTVQLLVAGIQTGALYALTAVGFALIFGATRIFHVVHGNTFAIAGYVFLEAYKRGLHWTVSIILALLVAIGFSLLVNRVFYRPLIKRGGTFFTLFVASFGVSVASQSAVELVFGREYVSVSTPLTRAVELLPGLYVAPVFWISIATAAILFGLLVLFFERTNVGIALRALSENAELLRAFGLSSTGMTALAFALGSALCVPGAILISCTVGLNPSIGFHVMLVSMAATIVGGVGSLRGAALAGLLLGVAENLTVALVANQWREAASFVVLFLCIMIRPSGLFAVRAAR